MTNDLYELQNCGLQSDGKFCPNCGQQMETYRITLPHLLHEIIHTFTHLEKGFLFTLKKLITEAGRMQRFYLGGYRVHHQKPLNVFYLCYHQRLRLVLDKQTLREFFKAWAGSL